MHPTILLAAFILVAFFLAQGSIAQCLVGFGMLVLFAVVIQQFPIHRSVKMLKRMRWFFLSILILGLWFTPGEPLIPSFKMLSPTSEGLLWGLSRVGILILLIIGVALLLNYLPRSELLRALYYLIKPFRFLGFPPERFALRVTLTLQYLEQLDLQTEWQNTRNRKSLADWYTHLTDAFVQTFQSSRELAEKGPGEIEVDLGSPPNWYEWIIVLVLLTAFIFIGSL